MHLRLFRAGSKLIYNTIGLGLSETKFRAPRHVFLLSEPEKTFKDYTAGNRYRFDIFLEQEMAVG